MNRLTVGPDAAGGRAGNARNLSRAERGGFGKLS
jgi:hypothetical protein